MRRSGERDDEALRGLLRRGDPAGDGREPTPEELARMRREILSAAQAPRTTHPWLAWAAAAAVIVLTVLAGRGWLRSPEPAPPRVIAPPVAESAAAPSTRHGAEPRSAMPPETAAPRPPATIAARRNGPLEALPARTVGPRAPLNVQFTAPNGTRIIWKLDPDFRL